MLNEGLRNPIFCVIKDKKLIEVFRNQQFYQKGQGGKTLEARLIDKAGFEKKEARRE